MLYILVVETLARNWQGLKSLSCTLLFWLALVIDNINGLAID